MRQCRTPSTSTPIRTVLAGAGAGPAPPGPEHERGGAAGLGGARRRPGRAAPCRTTAGRRARGTSSGSSGVVSRAARPVSARPSTRPVGGNRTAAGCTGPPDVVGEISRSGTDRPQVLPCRPGFACVSCQRGVKPRRRRRHAARHPAPCAGELARGWQSCGRAAPAALVRGGWRGPEGHLPGVARPEAADGRRPARPRLGGAVPAQRGADTAHPDRRPRGAERAARTAPSAAGRRSS